MRGFLFLIMVLAVASCVDRTANPVLPSALSVGTPYTVFAASTRQREPDGTFGYERAENLSLLELTVSIPPNHQPGTLSFSYAKPNPSKQFTLAGQTVFASQDSFRKRVSQVMRQKGGLKEVAVFVHGYNATQTETAFRAAQLAYDVDLPGQMMIYSWPSQAKAFGYAYDIDSMLFARDGLESFLRQIKAAGADRIILIAHSMGSALTMEMLRQADIREPGWAKRTLNGVALISPDLDVDLFEKQMMSLASVPEPFFILVSEKDKILNLSARLRGNAKSERLGNISSIGQLADLPVEIIDMTAFSKDAQSSHFVAATSPSLLALFKSLQPLRDTLGPEQSGLEALIPPSQRNPTGAVEVELTYVDDQPAQSQ